MTKSSGWDVPSVQEILGRIVPRRKIDGNSAILLPFKAPGVPDYDALAAHVQRTAEAGLTPAVNMDTGYVNLLTDEERQTVLQVTQQALGPGRTFIAGAFIEGKAGEPVSLYQREIDRIREHGGTPIIFQCSAMKALDGPDLVKMYQAIAKGNGPLYAFELGEMFAPFGAIWDDDVARGIMEIPEIAGYKHSSLDRQVEWRRLELKSRIRPEFKLFTGNDLAIDMVMYGSDYLLGLSTFAPDVFAYRDRLWAEGSSRFYQVNDVLQYLGEFAFRHPTPAYKHSAAQFLSLRGWSPTDLTHPKGAERPASDKEILQLILERIEQIAAEAATAKEESGRAS